MNRQDIKTIENSDGCISISIPIKPKGRSGRKVITLPDGYGNDGRPWDSAPTPPQLALVRAYKWEAMLHSGAYTSIKALAQKEGVDNSYVSRMLNLTILAPDIITKILDEEIPDGLTLFDLGSDTHMVWNEQREMFYS